MRAPREFPGVASSGYPPLVACPSDDTLRAYALGTSDAEIVRDHIATCPKCAAVVAGVKSTPKLPFTPSAEGPRLSFKEEEPKPDSAAVTLRPTGEEES
jgi:hypothetical protein